MDEYPGTDGLFRRYISERHCGRIRGFSLGDREDRQMLVKTLRRRFPEEAHQTNIVTRSRLCDGKVDGPDDRLVSEMLKRKIFEVAHFSQERFMGKEQASDSWKNCAISLLEEARCRAEEGDQGFQGQTAVMSMWYATCVVLRMEEEAEAKEFEERHVGWSRRYLLPAPPSTDVSKNYTETGNCKNTEVANQNRDPFGTQQCTWPSWTSRRRSTCRNILLNSC